MLCSLARHRLAHAHREVMQVGDRQVPLRAAPGTTRTASTVADLPSSVITGSPTRRNPAGSQPWYAVSQGWLVVVWITSS